MIQRRRCRRQGRQQRPPSLLSIEALSLVIICIATAAGGERDGGEKLDSLATTTIWPDIANTNDKIWTGNKCAGHMTKSKTCGANSNKYDLECCPGLSCDGKFCISAVVAADDDKNDEDQRIPMTKDTVTMNNETDTNELNTKMQREANHTATMQKLELARQEMAQKRKEEEERRRKQAEEQERAGQRAADEERRRREELQRQEEAKARRPKEKRALIRLYEDTNGDKWNRSGGWLNDDVDQCMWEGITCNKYGLVTKIILAQNNMVGTIPNMQELQQLDLIDMHANELEAALPIRVDYPSLRYVDLSKNKLYGDITSISYDLEYLDLSSNRISGVFEPSFDLDVLCPSDSPSSAPSSIPSSAPTSSPSAAPSSGPTESPTSENMTAWNETVASTNVNISDVDIINEVVANMAEEDLSTHSNDTLAHSSTLTKLDDLGGAEGTNGLPICGAKLRYLNLAENEFEYINLSELTSLQHIDAGKNKYMDQPLASLGLNGLSHVENLSIGGSYRVFGDLRIGHMKNLKHLDLKNMRLGGEISKTGITDIKTLEHIDLSEGNNFRGEFYFCNMTALETLKLAGNGLHGDLTSCDVSSLKICDLSDNNYSGSLNLGEGQSELSELMLHRNTFSGPIPRLQGLSKLSRLHLGENAFTGTIPFISLPYLRYFNISFNEITGSIPPSISNLPVCDTIDLSHQAKSEYNPSTGLRVTRGISGKIPSEIGQLPFLQQIILSDNLLSSTIPDSVAQLTYLRQINVEDNLLFGSIPPSINILEQLGTVRLARNRLTGEIPDLGGSQETVRVVTMAGNPGLSSPAPFNLCDLDDLDLRSNPTYCPSDRSALAAFYSSTKGSEWLINTNWMSPTKSHCEWYGVTCSPDGDKTLKLELVANGVAGQLPDEFFEIKTLQVLDLNDNDIRGDIPPLIKEFRDLQVLRLSYNRLTSVPDEIEQLKNLVMVHLHSNRLEGTADKITLVDPPEGMELPEHRFISDCGDPQDVSDPFTCSECDMCSNSLEECQEPHRRNYTAAEATGILVAAVFAAICAAWFFVRVLVSKKILKESNSFAKKAAGDESVYSFFLSKSPFGWLIATGTILVQVLVFALFLSAASFENDDGDFVYSWRCPLNTPECNDERAVSAYGWVMWAFLVLSALFDDFLSGIKLIFLSASRGSKPAFCTGMSLACLTALAVYSSLFYNIAIAMTNTELIVNAVILLFVNELDEQVFSIVSICNSSYADRLSNEAEEYSGVLLDQHLNDQRRKSTIDAIRNARFLKARSTEARAMSPRDRRNLWRGRMGNNNDILVRIGSGDLFSVGSHEGSVLSGDNGSPIKGALQNEVDLVSLVISLKQRVEELERDIGTRSVIRYSVETESVEEDGPSLAVASASSDEEDEDEDSIEIPHVSL